MTEVERREPDANRNPYRSPSSMLPPEPQAFARHRRLHTPETAGERLLIEHFKRMMDAAANYVEPTVYIARHPDLNVIGDCTWVREFPEPNQQQSETGVAATKQRRDQAFIRDMLYMLDGPEQRAALSTRPPEVEALVEAAAELLAGMSSTYTARNGREMGIEADDGEKCWIVHSDLIAHLKGALSRIKETGNG